MKLAKISICIFFIMLIQMGASGQEQIIVNKLGIKDITPKWLNVAPNNVFVYGDYLYANDGFSGMHIYDITIPDSPFWIDKLEDKFISDVAFSGNYAFLACPYHGFYIADISAPKKVQIVNAFDSRSSNGRYHKLLWNPYHVVVKGDYAFITFSEGNIRENPKYGIKVFDINPVKSATEIASIELPHLGGNLKLNGNHAYLVDKYKGLLDIDISNPESPKIAKKLDIGKELPMHCTHDDNATIEIGNGYLYICAGKDGLRVIDIDPADEIHEVKSIPTPESAVNATVKDGYAYVCSGGKKSVYIIDIDPIENANPLGFVKLPTAINIALKGDYGYVSNGYEGLSVVDFSNTSSPRLVQHIENLVEVDDIFVSNGYAYLLSGKKGLLVVDIDPIETASIVATMEMPYSPGKIAVSNDVALISNPHQGLHIVDISQPERPEIIKTIEDVRAGGDIIVSGDYAFILNRNRIDVIDIQPPQLAFELQTIEGFGEEIGFLSNDRIYAIGSKIDIIDISNPFNIKLVKSIDKDDIKEEMVLVDGLTVFPKGNPVKSTVDVRKMNLQHFSQFNGFDLDPLYQFEDYYIALDNMGFVLIEKDAIFDEALYSDDSTLFEYHTMNWISDAFHSDGKLYLVCHSGLMVFEL